MNKLHTQSQELWIELRGVLVGEGTPCPMGALRGYAPSVAARHWPLLHDLRQKACTRSDTWGDPVNGSCLQGEIFGNCLLNLPDYCHLICPVHCCRSKALGFAPWLFSGCSPGRPREPARDIWPKENHCRLKHSLSTNLTIQWQNTTTDIASSPGAGLRLFSILLVSHIVFY